MNRIAWLAAIVALGYLLQLPSPLRLHDDTINLLTAAESGARGGPLHYHGAPTLFPPGYPTLMALLIRVGAGNAWVFMAVNFVFLAIGLAAFRTLGPPAAALALAPLSFVWIKYGTTPLTEPMFFAACMAALAAMHAARDAPLTPWRLLRCFALVAAALLVRRNGIALIPPLLWTLATHPDARKAPARLWALAATAFAGLLWIAGATTTLRDYPEAAAGLTVPQWIGGLVAFRAREFGEIGFNLSAPALTPGFQAAITAVGGVLLLAAFVPVAMRFRRLSPSDVFLLAYAAILFVWPYSSPRFWFAALPLLIANVAETYRRAPRILAHAHAVLFVVLGLLTLGSGVAISYAGKGFGDRYRYYHGTYCEAGYCEAPAPAGSEVHPDGVRLLRTYPPLWAGH